MANSGISVSDFAAVLEYAAGSGAGRIASAATASGNVRADIGANGQIPGSALQAVLARQQGRSTRTSNAASDADIPKIADRMAKTALNQGAKLLSGGQK